MSAHRPVIMACEHVVSAGHYLATEAGMAVLDAGGNAIDAGVAAGLAMGVVQSDLVNVAGVAPIMIHLAGSGETLSIDGLGTWPRAANPAVFTREHAGVVPEGILRTVVPGAPHAWLTALERFGTRSFAEVAAGAIRLARNGFAIEQYMCAYIESHIEGYRRWPENTRIYLRDGRAPVPGERFVQADLASSLEYMAAEEAAAAGSGRKAGITAARDAFYRGDIAKAICDYHRTHGGWMTREDLAGYRARFEPTVVGRFRDYDVHCCGPWSQGPALAQALAMLDGAELAGLAHNGADYVHLVTETLKLAFADRERYFGDPAFVDVPVRELLAPAYLAARRELIRPGEAWPDLPPPGDPMAVLGRLRGAAPPPASGALSPRPDPHDTLAGVTASGRDTSYVCVADREGNLFSATPSDTSSDTPVIPGTGLCPSSRGCQSRADPAHPASVAPGKRPRLTPNPAIALRDGRGYMAFGTPGGDVQVQAMVQMFLNVTHFDMNLQEAIEAPRFASFSYPSSFSPHAHHPGLLAVEGRIDGAVVETLRARGHVMERWPEWTRQAGALGALTIDPDTGIRHAGADPRRAAYAMGR